MEGTRFGGVAERTARRWIPDDFRMTQVLIRDQVRESVDLASEADLAIGAMTVRPSACEVEIAGAVQKLEPRVMQVLVVLAMAQGAVVSRDDLIQTCWGGTIVGDDAINRIVGRVRRLSELGSAPSSSRPSLRSAIG